MHETDADIAELQALLNRSYAGAGPHLLSIHTDNWRVSAEQLCDLLQGMCILNVATVNSKGEPVISPMDGVFYRGRWFVGSSHDSLRAKHLKTNPNVAGAHTRGEQLSVTVHGVARELDWSSERAQGYRRALIEIYGQEMTDAHQDDGALYWEIEPRKMFAIAPDV